MDILFYGHHYWDQGAWFRKQYFAHFLSKRNHRVFYIENSVSMFRWRPGHKNRFLKTQLSMPQENLYVITPSAFFPFPNSYYTRHLFNLKLLADIRRIFRRTGVKEYMVWFNLLNFSTVLPRLKDKKIVFDMSDDIPLFFQLKNMEGLYKTQLRLLKMAYAHASIPVVTAKKIKEKYQQYAKNEIMVIPNGHNFTSFSENSLPEPDDMKDIPGPRIGFLGTLFIFTDDELLEQIISQRPQYQYVFVGKVQKEFPIDRIRKYPNVHILGEKKKEEVGAYLNAMDICINPFKRHEVNDSVSPLKVYEYLAFRKPVVSSLMYSLQQEEISKHISFCENAEAFLETMDAMVKKGDFVNPIPEKELMENSWESQFEKMIKRMKEQYGFEL
jgi:glycosyltransferase involved in cell wall biosynthesis